MIENMLTKEPASLTRRSLMKLESRRLSLPGVVKITKAVKTRVVSISMQKKKVNKLVTEKKQKNQKHKKVSNSVKSILTQITLLYKNSFIRKKVTRRFINSGSSRNWTEVIQKCENHKKKKCPFQITHIER
jgi:hypothetical protein